MVLTFCFAVLFLLSFFSPENLVTTGIGWAVTLGLTHFVKTATGLQGVGALILAIVVSFVVAIAAVVISGLLGGSGFSWDSIATSGSQIFALATIAYKLLMADSQPST